MQPVAIITLAKGNRILIITGNPVEIIKPDASHSTYPDGDRMSLKRSRYNEVDFYQENFETQNPAASVQTMTIPEDPWNHDLYVVMEFRD
jgi:hypothetical protein